MGKEKSNSRAFVPSLKVRQLKYRLKHDFFSAENIVLVAAVVMCLVWTFQSIEAMSRNWTLTERLNAERHDLELITIEVETAELENEYLKSTEYQELAARRLAGKQLPGEHLISLPPNSEAAKTKHQAIADTTDSADASSNYSNPEKWLMYLFPNR